MLMILLLLPLLASATAFSLQDEAAAATAFSLDEPSLRESSPSLCDDVTQYAGYFDLRTGLDKHYFYWFFEARKKPANAPVVLWMTGGPGCSSEVALFGENGPCAVNAAGNGTKKNAFSWNEHANLIYIDQPAGTGFSYGTGYDSDEKGVSTDMVDFLKQFFEAHPEYAKNDFYIFGESYGGHYVPAVTHAVWLDNKAGGTVNLKGMGVGNGLTNPEIQYKYYKDMIVSTNNHDAAVSETVHKLMSLAAPACVAAIRACERNGTSTVCLPALELCEATQLMPYTATGLNPYDMRVQCAKPPLCYDFSNVKTYLNRDDVRKALGVDDVKRPKKWADCSKSVTVGFELGSDYLMPFDQLIPDLLNDGLKVLIYAGDQDYICNWLGNQAWTLALEWKGKKDFNSADVADWSVDGAKAGEFRTAHNFTFLRVLDAGHMVPMDQPKVALAMLDQFTLKQQ